MGILGKNSDEELKEAVWCDHAGVSGLWIDGKPLIHVDGNLQSLFLVLEEGKVKIVCRKCLITATSYKGLRN